jgi:hypothetical protein
MSHSSILDLRLTTGIENRSDELNEPRNVSGIGSVNPRKCLDASIHGKDEVMEFCD